MAVSNSTKSTSQVPEIIVVGAGGHARVVARAAASSGIRVAGFYDDNESMWGTMIDGLPVQGPINLAAEAGLPAVIGIGDNSARKAVAESLNLEWVTLVHPFAFVDEYATLGRGTVVLPGSIVHRGAVVGNHVILNTKASVDHDCRADDFMHVAVAHMGGGSSADEGSFMALGSILLPGVNLGAWSILGAGAIATHDIPRDSVAVGVPAKCRDSRQRSAV